MTDLKENIRRQQGELSQEEKAEIAKLQKEACGYMTPEEIGEAQRKALI